MTTVAVNATKLKLCELGSVGGMILPVLGQFEQKWNKNMRAFLYLVGLLYLLAAVSVGCDYFMASIERITSKRKRVMNKQFNRLYTKRVWNDTIANLSLFAFGSSAPIILLSIVEVVADGGFYSGGLGSGCIVGTAAYNLMFTSSVCIVCIPSGETRHIDAISVYHVTAVVSIFAYTWIYIVVCKVTPDIIDLWEAIVTFGMFFILLFVGYLADKGKCGCCRFERSPPGNGEATGLLDGTKADEAGAQGRQRVSNASQELGQESFGKGGSLQPHSVHPKVRHSVVKLHSQLNSVGQGRDLGVGGRGAGPGFSSAGRRASLDKVQESTADEDDEGVPPAGTNAKGQICGEDQTTVIENPYGVITFREDERIIEVTHDEAEEEVEVLRRNGSRGEVTVRYATYPLTAVEGYDYERDEGELVFAPGETSKIIPVRIFGKQPYAKSDAFQLILEEVTGGATFNPNDDGSEHQAIVTFILENATDPDDEDVNCIEKCFAKCFDLENLKLARDKYRAQVENSCVEADGEDGKAPGAMDYLAHSMLLPCKVAFAIAMPPTNLGGGWVCFTVALLWIGLLAVLICDFASFFGCCAGVEDSVTAITIVAFGASLPNTFASMVSAKKDKYADGSIVTWTGNNCVNVFLGIGLPWTIGALYWMVTGVTTEWKEMYPEQAKLYPKGGFVVVGDTLGFNIIAFISLAISFKAVLRIRRRRFGGELGGPNFMKLFSSLLGISLWLAYIYVVSWRAQAKQAEVAKEPLMVIAGVFVALAVIIDIMKCMGCKGRTRKEPPPESVPLAPEKDEVPPQKLGKGMEKLHKEEVSPPKQAAAMLSLQKIKKGKAPVSQDSALEGKTDDVIIEVFESEDKVAEKLAKSKSTANTKDPLAQVSKSSPKEGKTNDAPKKPKDSKSPIDSLKSTDAPKRKSKLKTEK